jgi:hypothetical protein
MKSIKSGTVPAACLLAVAILGLAGCASLSARLPWRHKAPPPVEVSTALTVAAPDGAALPWPQFWKRNDVVLDMSGVAGTGSAVVQPRSGLTWPVRVVLRLAPGAVGAIDVRGAQRLVVPVPAGGAATVDVELPPGIYRAATRQLRVSWGPLAPTEP